jgi:hypothetical protein
MAGTTREPADETPAPGDHTAPRISAHVTLLPQIKTKGWVGPQDDGRSHLHPTAALLTALETRHDTDRMACAYTVHEATPDGLERLKRSPRLNKRALSAIREGGGQIVMETAFFDLDRPEHAPWPSSATAEAAARSLADDLAGVGGLLEGAGFYTTWRGIRVVFALEPTVSPERFEQVIASFAVPFQEALSGHRLVLDRGKLGWHALFRLPFSKRDDVGPEFEPALILDGLKPIGLDRLACGSSSDATSSGHRPLGHLASSGSRPSDHEVETILIDWDGWDRPDLRKTLDRRQPDLLRSLHQGSPPFERGERHNWSVGTVAAIVARLGCGDPLPPYLYLWRVTIGACDLGVSKTAREDALEDLWSICEWAANEEQQSASTPAEAERQPPSLDGPRNSKSVWWEKLYWNWSVRGDSSWERTSVKSTIPNLELILRHHPRWQGAEGLWFDSVRERVYGPFGPRGKDEEFQDHHVTLIRSFLYDVEIGGVGARIRASKNDVFDVVASEARRNQRDLLKEFLDGLPAWDGQPRLDTWLAVHGGAEDSLLTRAYSRKWAVGCIARVLEPGCKLDTVLLLVGRQGGGKSRLFGAWCPDDWFSDTHIPVGNKDAMAQLAGAWIYESAELAGVKGRDSESVKAFLSSAVDTYRPPYGRTPVRHPRRTVIVGTSNRTDVLTDATGDRRWWCVRVDRQDPDRLRLDRDQLWAEALLAYRQGMAELAEWELELASSGTASGPKPCLWWLTRAEEEERAAANVVFRSEDPWEGLVLGYASQQRQEFGRASIAQIHEKMLQIDSRGWPSERRMADILTQHGWSKFGRQEFDGRRRTVWEAPADWEDWPSPKTAIFGSR